MDFGKSACKRKISRAISDLNFYAHAAVRRSRSPVPRFNIQDGEGEAEIRLLLKQVCLFPSLFIAIRDLKSVQTVLQPFCYKPKM